MIDHVLFLQQGYLLHNKAELCLLSWSSATCCCTRLSATW